MHDQIAAFSKTLDKKIKAICYNHGDSVLAKKLCYALCHVTDIPLFGGKKLPKETIKKLIQLIANWDNCTEQERQDRISVIAASVVKVQDDEVLRGSNFFKSALFPACVLSSSGNFSGGFETYGIGQPTPGEGQSVRRNIVHMKHNEEGITMSSSERNVTPDANPRVEALKKGLQKSLGEMFNTNRVTAFFPLLYWVVYCKMGSRGYKQYRSEVNALREQYAQDPRGGRLVSFLLEKAQGCDKWLAKELGCLDISAALARHFSYKPQEFCSSRASFFMLQAWVNSLTRHNAPAYIFSVKKPESNFTTSFFRPVRKGSQGEGVVDYSFSPPVQ